MVGIPSVSENTSFGSEPPKFGSTAAGLPVVRVGRPFDPGAVEIGARGDEALRRADLHHRKTIGMNMVPHGVDDLLMSGADHEAKLQHGTGVAGNGVGGL